MKAARKQDLCVAKRQWSLNLNAPKSTGLKFTGQNQLQHTYNDFITTMQVSLCLLALPVIKNCILLEQSYKTKHLSSALED